MCKKSMEILQGSLNATHFGGSNNANQMILRDFSCPGMNWTTSVNHHLRLFFSRPSLKQKSLENLLWFECGNPELLMGKIMVFLLCFAIETFLLKVQARLRAAAEVAGETEGLGGAVEENDATNFNRLTT